MTSTAENWLNNLRFGADFQNYTLLERIGTGGQGVVWSAIHRQKKQVVALKLNLVSADDEAMTDDRVLERQMEKLLPLRHPHILSILDIGVADNIRYLSTPYLTGGTLYDRIEEHSLSTEQVLSYTRQIAAALDYLHQAGVIHRDLKPANVLLDARSNARLTDFGLARFVGKNTQPLHTGRGTPPYSPPEQHALQEISIQSDIYSFGIMLYELFTGQLPWNGEKTLGVLQLYMNHVLPHPCEIAPDLPVELGTILREMTAKDPQERPASAGAAARMVYEIFGVEYIEDGEGASDDEEAQVLIARALPRWNPDDGTARLDLTDFALVNLVSQPSAPDQKYAQFMLHNALVYNLDVEKWWQQLDSPADRFLAALGVLSYDTESITERLLDYLLKDQTLHGLKLPERVQKKLFSLLLLTENVKIKQAILDCLILFSPSSARWQPDSVESESAQFVARLAREDSPLGNTAAHLIGHLRSQSMLDMLLKQSPPAELVPTLVEVQSVAGDLPANIPFSARVAVSGEILAQRVVTHRARLFMSYLTMAVGIFLGIGWHVYSVSHLPAMMAMTRVGLALEQGLLAGILFSTGLLIARSLVELFPEAPALPRAGLATLVGAPVLALAFWVYDLIFLQNTPDSWLFPAGILLITLGFVLSGLVRPLPVKILLSFGAVFAAIALSWWGHRSWASSAFEFSPLIFYPYDWSDWKVLQLMFWTSLPMGVLGSLFSIQKPS